MPLLSRIMGFAAPYIIVRSKGTGKVVLRCKFCPYKLNPKDFAKKDGHQRSQAAKAMISHAEKEHPTFRSET